MPKQPTTQLTHLVDTFVSQLTTLVHEQALDMVREALGEAKAPANRRGPGRPRKTGRGPGRPRKTGKNPGRPRKAAKAAAPKRTGKRGRRSADEVAAMGTTVLAHVRDNPGQRLEEIGRELGTATKELKRPIANMLAEGMLRTTGQKRGTKYFVGSGAKRKA